MMYEFDWDPLDHRRLGPGNGIGHLMECGAQVTGGYFADPGFKDVPRALEPGFPDRRGRSRRQRRASPRSPAPVARSICGPSRSRSCTKCTIRATTSRPTSWWISPPRSSSRSAPTAYASPTSRAKPRTPTLKVSIGCTEGFIGEDMFFYAGPGALRRAQLARQILEERFRIVKLDAEELRIDFLGLNAIHGEMTPKRPARALRDRRARRRPHQDARGSDQGRTRSRRHGRVGRGHDRQARPAPGPHPRGHRRVVVAGAAREDRPTIAYYES